MNSKGASQPEPQTVLFAAIDPILGYLNYGNGSFDARFFQNLNVAFGLLGADVTANQTKEPSLTPEALASDLQSKSKKSSSNKETQADQTEALDLDPASDCCSSRRRSFA